MTPATRSPTRVTRELHRLARAWGVQTAFYDCFGVRHHASVETLLTVLASLGAPVAGLRDVGDALAARSAARWTQPVEPVLVAWDGAAQPLELRVPESVADGRLLGELRLESGATRALAWDLASAPRVQAGDVDGVRRVVLHVDLAAVTPLPPGSHALQLSLGGHALESPGRDGAVTIISAPTRVDGGRAPARDWGAFLPLFALRSKRSLGVGDLRDLGDLAEWVADRGGRALATLPLLAAFLDGERGDGGLFEASPYVPASRLAWNELYADLSAEPEWRAPQVAALAADPRFVAERDALQRADYHDYRRLAQLRRPLMDAMARAAFDSPRRAELEAWAAGDPTRADYARFRGACSGLGGSFHGWPEAAARGALTDADVDGDVERRHLYAQFIAGRQVEALAARCRERGLRVLLDQPLGVHPDGYDVWRHGELFAPGVSCGAPPDAFFVKGQDWGFRPLLPEASRADGYAYVGAALRQLLLPGQMLRMDHVLGLQRLFWVPHGAPASAGVYVRGNPDEHFAVLCLEASRAGALVVGEDLGTVPRGLRARLGRHGLLRTHVLQFSAHARVPAASVAGLNTQDLPPFAGFLDGADIDGFAELGLIDPAQQRGLREERAQLVADLRTWHEERGELSPGADGHALMRACNAGLAASRAAMVLVNLEDLWDEPRSHNVPGTSHERPNWRRAAARTLEDLRDDDEVTACLAEVDERRARRRRKPARAPGDEPSLGLAAIDLELFASGRHAHVHDLLGGHREVAEDIAGARFGCWAPGATSVAVFGDFDGWRPDKHPLAHVGGGLWQAFVPGAPRGAHYKFRVVDADGARDHADPFAVRGEGPRGEAGSDDDGEAAARLWTREFDWTDGAWLAARAERAPDVRAADLLDVSAGERGWVAARDELIARARAQGLRGLRVTGAAWGPLPCAPGPAGGVPQELMELVDAAHGAGLLVVFAWRPDPRAFDLSHEAAADVDPWARPERWSLTLSAALLRVAVFHADGLELPADDDAPAGFHERLAVELAERHPGVRLVESRPAGS